MNSFTAAELNAAAAMALETVPCNCGPEYYERALTAPDCYHHDLADEMSPWFRCWCVGCQRWAAAISKHYGPMTMQDEP